MCSQQQTRKKSEICKEHKEEVHTRKNHASKFPILKNHLAVKIGKSEIVWDNFSIYTVDILFSIQALSNKFIWNKKKRIIIEKTFIITFYFERGAVEDEKKLIEWVWGRKNTIKHEKREKDLHIIINFPLFPVHSTKSEWEGEWVKLKLPLMKK